MRSDGVPKIEITGIRGLKQIRHKHDKILRYSKYIYTKLPSESDPPAHTNNKPSLMNTSHKEHAKQRRTYTDKRIIQFQRPNRSNKTCSIPRAFRIPRQFFTPPFLPRLRIPISIILVFFTGYNRRPIHNTTVPPTNRRGPCTW